MFTHYNTLFESYNEMFDLNEMQADTMRFTITDLLTSEEAITFNNKLAVRDGNKNAVIRQCKEIDGDSEQMKLYNIKDCELYGIINDDGEIVTSYFPCELMTYGSEEIANYIMTSGDGYDVLNKHKSYYVEEFVCYTIGFIRHYNIAVKEDYKSVIENMVRERYLNHLITDRWHDLIKIAIAEYLLLNK